MTVIVFCQCRSLMYLVPRSHLPPEKRASQTPEPHHYLHRHELEERGAMLGSETIVHSRSWPFSARPKHRRNESFVSVCQIVLLTPSQSSDCALAYLYSVPKL